MIAARCSRGRRGEGEGVPLGLIPLGLNQLHLNSLDLTPLDLTEVCSVGLNGSVPHSTHYTA